MANRGDMNLAKELRAEFGRAKPPRRKGQKLGNQFGNELRPTPPYHREQFDRVKSNRDEARGGQLPSGRQRYVDIQTYAGSFYSVFRLFIDIFPVRNIHNSIYQPGH
ncbi:hypothetical protein GGR50DRAFT_284386 [Xylaria sp. CBS 124048]|nr:hypothetical protein GGR50DRAFT_284386 [Xylaria sp. CBS 124048]